MPRRGQKLGDEIPHGGIVLHEQNEFGAAAGGVGFFRNRGRRLRGAGKVDRERRPASGLALDEDRTFTLLHDAVDGGETEPVPLAVRLGREERLEDMREHFARHADPGIFHPQTDPVPGLDTVVNRERGVVDVDVGRLDRKAPSFGHRVPGVESQVQDHLLELRGFGLHRRNVVTEPHVQLDILTEHALQHPLGIAHHVVEVEDTGSDDLAAGEGEEAMGQIAGPLRRAPDLRERGAILLGADRARLQEFGVAEDGGQQVVEVVGDAAGQPADALQALSLMDCASMRSVRSRRGR